MNDKELIDLFLQLVKIDAVSRQERPVADFLKQRLEQLGLDVVEDQSGAKINGNCGNLIIRLPGSNNDQEPLLLLAHMDTVHSTANLKPVIDGDTLRSDGTTILGVDNRAGVTLILYVIQELIRKQKKHKSLEIIFTVAEELGMLGAMALDFDHIRAKQGFVFDCTAVPGGYVASTPTAYDFKIHFSGRPAHSAVAPEKGINALSMAAQVMNGFPVGRVNEHSVANFGTIHGGSADNVVPDKIDLTGEIRSFLDAEIDRMQEQLRSLCQRAAQKWGGQCEPVFLHSFQGFQFHAQMPLVQRLHRAFARIGVQPNPMVYYGGSDANVFNQHGVQIINTGIGAYNPHANEEHIHISDLMKSYELVMHLIEAE